jgi:DNA primase
MPFPQSFLDELIARNDIVDVVGSYVSLTPKGGSFWGCCPFHNEKTPSFHVLPDKQFYHCFGCKKGGGVINFVMDIENLSYPDAVRFLAKRANIPVPEEASDGTEKLRRRMLELNRDAARWYYQTLQAPEGQAVRDYLDRRQIHRKIAVRFGMGAAPDSWDALLTAMTARGYSKDELIRAGLAVSGKNGHIYDKFRNRLILPVIDVRGDVVGFGSRVLDKSEPKYMNTPETLTYSKRRVLYGLNLAKKTKRPNIILCEGNLDVVTLHQAGFDNAVASMGTALTVEQTRLLSRYTKELVLCYDNDKAGALATQRALELLNRSEFTVRVLRLPNRLVDGDLYDADGNLHRLAEFIGKYILLDFWSAGCGPCVQAIPELQEIARKYAGRVAVVSISQDPKPVWKEFIAEKQLVGNQWNELVDGDTRLGMRYGVKEIPHFVLIAPDGRIQDVW